jgi:RNA polymerase sigma factor for flagellar operon FliA
MNVNLLWQKYQDTKDEQLRMQLTTSYLPLVRLHAGRLAMALPQHVSRDDLLQSGVLGLMEALQRFDPSRGIKFETYAGQRIRGAMLDELRRLCWLPRTLFRRIRELDKVSQILASRLGRDPEEAELARELEMPLEELQKIMGQINCRSLLSLEDILFSPPAEDGPETEVLEKLIAEEESTQLASAIEKLPERYRRLLALYYQEEMTLKEIGLILGVSESRVCQLHAQVIARLRTLLTAAR